MVRFKSGSSRLVLILPEVRIVIKVAKLNVPQVFRYLKRHYKGSSSVNQFCKRFVELEMWRRVVKPGLFAGVLANWNEYTLFCQTQSAFLCPTYFSLLGVINIQKYGKDCDLDDDKLYEQLAVITDNAVSSDAHHFYYHGNFTLDAGWLQMTDYGSPKCRSVVKQYGDKIVHNFLPQLAKQDVV